MKTGFKGASLIELLVGFSIFGILSILVATIYFAHIRLFSNQNTLINVASQNRLALDEMANQIREGQSVVASCCSGEITSSTVLVLQLWPINASGEPIDFGGAAYDYVIYKLDPSDTKKLIKTTNPFFSSRPGGQDTLATDVATNGLQFVYDNADPTLATSIKITLTTSALSGNKTHTTTQTVEVGLRNK